ncbi:transglutaminase domain-containing protein [Paenibacillus sp. BR2-3]|uniref:DUF4129 domain-containing transglutaminase family protein n=1 Tax=Paenibacillus sp. BR2-3 TaxID=3048494 RepID=UPI0039772A99
MSHLENGRYFSEIKVESSFAGNEGRTPMYFRLLFSLPIMGLFIEWLHPLYNISKTQDTRVLLAVLALAAALLLLCGLCQLPGWLLLSAQSSVVVLSWSYLCAKDKGIFWLRPYLREIGGDALLLFSGNISDLGQESRLLILLAGWGMLVASVQHLALFRGSISLFSAVTLTYLLLLDRLAAIHTMDQLVISTGLILWLKGMCGILALQEKNPGQSIIPYARWGSAAFITAAAVTVISWSGGEVSSTEPGARVSLQPMLSRLHVWATEQAVKKSGGTTGYSSGEGELGKPLSSNAEPVFTAESRIPVYWRGESYTYYDGRSWSRGNDDSIPLNLSGLPDKSASFNRYSESRILHQRIQFAVPSSGGLPLFSAGRVLDIAAVQLTDGSRLGFVFANKEKDSFRLPDVAGSARVTEYTVKSLLPETDPDHLRRLARPDPAEIRNTYLELPSALPRRVSSLAEAITAPAGGRYDATVAVRDYLQNRYTYTLDTRVPPPGSDFVDDFLFETKEGYCVHFATAMITLLRSVDIPARYVKGFGPGTAVEGSAPQRYVVTQGDAHAWVEVYFPGEGWVPFDPTPGSAAGSALPPQSAPAALGADALPARLRQGGSTPAPLAAAALLLPAAAWRWRRSLALLLAARSSSARTPEQLLAAAAPAWHGLAARYGPPPPGMTGREYAASLPIEDARLREAVWQFVRQWEALAYSPASSPPSASSPDFGHSVPGSSPNAHRTAAGTQPPPSGSSAGFIRVCLGITFRLT